jgi:hypothetical protein
VLLSATVCCLGVLLLVLLDDLGDFDEKSAHPKSLVVNPSFVIFLSGLSGVSLLYHLGYIPLF